MADPLEQPGQQLTVQQFAARLRQKFQGAYDDLPDDVLVDKTLDHYPQYRDMVMPAAPQLLPSHAPANAPALLPSHEQQPAQPEATVGPYEPSTLERISHAVTAGIPNIRPWEKKGEMQLLSPEQAMTPAEREEHPILTGAGEVVGGLTSPENVALLAGTAGLGSLPGTAGRILPRVVSGVFTASMVKGAYDTVPAIRAAADRGDVAEVQRLLTHLVGNAAFAYAAGRHAAKGSAGVPETEVAPEVSPEVSPVEVPRSAPALPWLRKPRTQPGQAGAVEPEAATPTPPEPTSTEPTPPEPATAPERLTEPQAPAPPIPGQYGSESVVKTPTADIPTRYKVVEAHDLIPSHDAEGFNPHMMYPAGIQERAYHTSKEAQARVIEQAQNYDPRYTVNTNPDAVNGPPIVTPDGIVLGGNSRTMSTQRLYNRGEGDQYRDYLRTNAQQFGLNPQDLDRMENPVLVREVPTPPDFETARRLASELNKTPTGALGVSERAVSAGKSITPKSLSAISGMLDQLGPDSSIRDLLRERGADVLKILTDDGAITARERPQFVDSSTGGLSEEGKTFAERALLGTVVDDPTLMDRAPKSVINKLDGSLADVATISPRTDEYNLVPLIREAIQEHADVVAHGSNLETHLAQAGMFGPPRNPVVDAIARKLAQKPKAVRAAFRDFAREANVDQQAQGFLPLAEEKPTAASAFNRAFGTRFTDAEFEQAVMQSLRRESQKGAYAEEVQSQAGEGNASLRQQLATRQAQSAARRNARIAASVAGSTPQYAIGPGAKTAGTKELFDTPLQQLTKWLPNVTTPRQTPLERMKAITGAITGKLAYVHDNFRRTMLKAETSILGLWDAYRRPPAWTDFDHAVGEWQGAIQYSAWELKKFADELKKVLPDKTRREALTNWIQAGGDEGLLRQRALTAKAPLRAAYEASLNLTPEERALANNMRGYLDSQLEEAQRAGMLEHGVENYISQLWNKDAAQAEMARAVNGASELQTRPFWTRERIFRSYFEGEDAGWIPKDKDAGYLLSVYHQSFAKAVADRGLVKQLLKAHASDGRTLVQVSGVGRTLTENELSAETRAHLIIPHAKGETAGDYLTVNSPALRRWKWVGKDSEGKPIYLEGDLVVHPEVYRKVYNLLSDSAIRKSKVGRAALKLSSEFKGTLLSLSLFHQTQIGVHALEHTVNPFQVPKIDLDNLIQRALVDHGLQIADFSGMEAFSEGLHGSGLINKIPGIGQKLQEYQTYLFRDYIPRVKMSMAEHALRRNIERYQGKLNQDQILRLTAEQANAAFGELNYTMMARNKTLHDVTRLILLAPDFLEARSRFVGQALKPYGREQQRALILGAAVMYVGARIANQVLNGDPDWDTQHAFSIRVGKRLYALRTIQGDLMHLVTDPRSFAAHRLNPITTRPLLEAVTGRDEFGRPQNLQGQLKDVAKGIMPIPLQALTRPGDYDIKESAAKGMGITAYRYRSRAARTAHELVLKGGFGESTRTPAEQKLMTKYRSDIDAGKLNPENVRADYKAGKLRERDAKTLLSESKTPQLERDFRRLSLERALEVWDLANDQERTQLRPILLKKKSQLENRVPAQRAPLEQKLKAALSEKSAPQPAIPAALRKLLGSTAAATH